MRETGTIELVCNGSRILVKVDNIISIHEMNSQDFPDRYPRDKTVVVVSAGDDGNPQPLYTPSTYDEVLAAAMLCPNVVGYTPLRQVD